MSALDDILTAYTRMAEDERIPAARAELAALRATVAEQARQLEQAREAIDDAVKHHGGGTKMLRAWLAANPAPAPQAEQGQTK